MTIWSCIRVIYPYQVSPLLAANSPKSSTSPNSFLNKISDLLVGHARRISINTLCSSCTLSNVSVHLILFGWIMHQVQHCSTFHFIEQPKKPLISLHSKTWGIACYITAINEFVFRLGGSSFRSILETPFQLIDLCLVLGPSCLLFCFPYNMFKITKISKQITLGLVISVLSMISLWCHLFF